MSTFRPLFAEAVGTFTLLIFGFFSIASAGLLTSQGFDPLIATLIVPFAFGLGLMLAIAIGGHASGGHFNPAVTLGALIDGRVSPLAAGGYVLAQLAGGVLAGIAILLIATADDLKNAVNQPGATAPGTLAQELHAFSAEAILTALFVATILTVSRTSPKQSILVIPLALVAIHYAGMHLSGASVNPVRSLIPAVFTGTYNALWVYLTAPFVGAILGWGVYRILTPPDDEVSIEIEDEDFLDDELAELDEDDED
jgi:aquaporin Z